jgi:hypothetical protein
MTGDLWSYPTFDPPSILGLTTSGLTLRRMDPLVVLIQLSHPYIFLDDDLPH